MSQPEQRSAFGAVALGAAATVMGTLPVFMTGAMAVQLTEELRFGAAGLGVAVACFRATAAVSLPFMGRLTDRLGAVRALRLAAAVSTIACVGIAASARSWWTLVAWLVLASVANALCQPAANRLLVGNVKPERRGLAFGFKQSSQPASSMIAGFSVPFIALTVGWRWAYLLPVALAAAVVLGARRRPTSQPVGRAQRSAMGVAPDRATVLMLAASFGLGNGVGAVVPTFFVDATVRAGATSSLAGTLLAVASIAAIATRFLSSTACDRMRGGFFRLCAALIAFGSVGFVLLATGALHIMAVGGPVALAGAWGFHGVFWFAVMRACSGSPGSITGALLPGALVGATVIPMVVGILADSVGYASGWLLAGALALCSAAGLLVTSRRLRCRAASCRAASLSTGRRKEGSNGEGGPMTAQRAGSGRSRASGEPEVADASPSDIGAFVDSISYRAVADGVALKDLWDAKAAVGGWDEWCDFWVGRAAEYEALADAALARGDDLSAADLLVLGSLSAHYGQFLYIADTAKKHEGFEVKAALFARAAELLSPPAERVEIPFGDDALPGYLRLPGPGTWPCAVLVGGLDAAKEDAYSFSNLCLARGVASLAIDGPGQGEALAIRGLPFRADAHTAVPAAIDHLATRPEIAAERIGVVGRSLGGYLATRAAADDERIRACVAWPGNYDMSNFATRPALNRLGYRFITVSTTMKETSEIVAGVTMQGAAERVRCPLYILHGGRDTIAPLEGGQRLAREVSGPVEMVVYDDGIHCNHDMAHVVRPAMADWLARTL